MFNKDKKYKDVPLDSEVFTKLSKYDSNDATNLGMLLANLSFPYLCCCWENENHFNKLLSKYKVTSSTGAVALVISDTVKTMVSNISTTPSAGMVAVEIVRVPAIAPAGMVIL